MVCFVFAALVVALDQLSKMWISANFNIGAQQELIPGVIGLTHVQNTGASFGILSDMRWLLVGISSVCVILLFVLMFRIKSVISRIGLAAILGGTFGNLIDRVLREGGRVIDMFELKFMDFAIFNVADCFLTVGCVIFCLSILFSREQPAVKPEAAVQSVGKGNVVAEPPVVASASPSIFGGTAKDLSETKILEEYDIERLLSEYNGDEKDD